MKTQVLTLIGVTLIFVVGLSIPHLSNVNPGESNFESVVDQTPTFVPARDADLLLNFNELIPNQDENCKLPCWWGFKLGETTLKEVAAFLKENKFDRHWRDSIYSDVPFDQFIQFEQIVLYFRDSSYFGEFTISFTFDENDILQGMRIRINQPTEWLDSEVALLSFPELLAQIDEVPEIYIAEYPSTFRLSDYRLMAVFKETGVEASYELDLSEENPEPSDGKSLLMCFDMSRIKSIELRLLHTVGREPLPDFFKTPENAYGIGISIEEFVRFFRENPDECLNVADYKAHDAETLTPTPIPTPVHYKLAPVVEELIITNGGCNLPCWWGFEIGQSKEREWLGFLEEQGFLTKPQLSASLHEESGYISYALGS